MQTAGGAMLSMLTETKRCKQTVILMVRHHKCETLLVGAEFEP